MLNSWARTHNPKEMVYRLCESLGKKTRNSREIVDFLRTIEVPKLIEAQEKLLTQYVYAFLFFYFYNDDESHDCGNYST